MPTPNNSDEELVEATNSSPMNIAPLPRAYSRQHNEMPPYPPSTVAIPEKLKKYYSNEVFRTVTFFMLMTSILSISSVAWFNGLLSSDQQLGIFSSLLFLATPSPIQSKPKKKIFYVNQSQV